MKLNEPGKQICALLHNTTFHLRLWHRKQEAEKEIQYVGWFSLPLLVILYKIVRKIENGFYCRSWKIGGFNNKKIFVKPIDVCYSFLRNIMICRNLQTGFLNYFQVTDHTCNVRCPLDSLLWWAPAKAAKERWPTSAVRRTTISSASSSQSPPTWLRWLWVTLPAQGSVLAVMCGRSLACW